MWKLDKPLLGIATGEDIDDLVLHCNLLSDADKPILKALYCQYDAQNGAVSNAQHNSVAANKAAAIKREYGKTYKGEEHYHLRDSLLKNVYRCPYCSINQPCTLDHYMPQSDYPALSMCRLNLVPMCADCNRKKNDYPYSGFIHPYYQSFPNRSFLVAKVTVRHNRIIVSFSLDQEAISDAKLEEKLNYQIDKIDLLERMSKSASAFVEDLCAQCHCFMGIGFELWLKMRLKDHRKRFGINDWRTAVLLALIESDEVDYHVFKRIAGNGGGAVV